MRVIKVWDRKKFNTNKQIFLKNYPLKKQRKNEEKNNLKKEHKVKVKFKKKRKKNKIQLSFYCELHYAVHVKDWALLVII